MKTVIWGLLIPFIGTAAGAACVFFLKKDLQAGVQRALAGFAAGVMVAASIWSLIVPAIDQSADRGRLAFLPAFIGFWLGILFLLLLDHVIPHLHRSIDRADQAEGPRSALNRTIMTSLTTLVVMVPLLVMVSSAISEFIVPLMVGVIVGCYSSIFICSPMYYDINKKDETSKYVLKQQEKAKAEKKNSKTSRKERKNK